MPERTDTLRRVSEDAFLLAHNIINGEDLEETEGGREYRIAELVIDLGERAARLSGFGTDDLWIPSGVVNLVDAS